MDHGVVGCRDVSLQNRADRQREVVARGEIGIPNIEAAGTGVSGELPSEFTTCSLGARVR